MFIRIPTRWWCAGVVVPAGAGGDDGAGGDAGAGDDGAGGDDGTQLTAQVTAFLQISVLKRRRHRHSHKRMRA